MATQSSVLFIGAPAFFISGRRSPFMKPVFSIGASDFSSFTSVMSPTTQKNISSRHFHFFSSVNRNSLFSSIHRCVLPAIPATASDCSQNSDRIDSADSVPSDTVGFAGDPLAGGDAAVTAAVENSSERQYTMGAPSGIGFNLICMFLLMLFLNNLFAIEFLRNVDQEKKKSSQDEGEVAESTVDRSSESKGGDELDERIERIRTMAMEVRREEMKGSDEIEEKVDERLTMDEWIPDHEKKKGGDGVVGDCLKMEGGLFTKGRNNPAMVVHQRFNMWGTKAGRQGVCGDIRVWSRRLNYSVNDDIFDGMRTKSNSKESSDEDSEGLTLDDMWWRTLPYVNAIYIDMGTGEDIFFTFKMLDRQTAYLVTFEDHTDATNFCYTCHTSFKDPDNFKAGTIPLTLKDLLEVTDLEQVIVVRRGQFKFYVGQPFPEIEMALRSLITRKIPIHNI